MDENISNLIKKFNEIKQMGYIKSITPFKNGSGITLENLLGANACDFPIPDLDGIELKALRNNERADFDLFNISPDGNHVYPSKWISERFGYPDKDFKDIKVFKGDINAKYMSKIGLFYYFKLIVNRKEEKIILNIYNYNGILINNDIFWYFDSVKMRLELKLKILALFNVDKDYKNDSFYYYYRNLKIYELKSFDVFLDLIEDGSVFVTFKTGVAKSGKYIGKFQDHGTAFRISKYNIEKLFNRIH